MAGQADEKTTGKTGTEVLRCSPGDPLPQGLHRDAPQMEAFAAAEMRLGASVVELAREMLDAIEGAHDEVSAEDWVGAVRRWATRLERSAFQSSADIPRKLVCDEVEWKKEGPCLFKAAWMGLRLFVVCGTGGWLWGVMHGDVMLDKGRESGELSCRMKAEALAKRYRRR